MSLKWQGEPQFGSIYGQEELATLNACLTNSISPLVGFKAKEEVLNFEAAFRDKVLAQHAVAFNGCGTALDAVLRSLDLSPNDEVVSCATNFHGTHLSVIGTGARLVLCDTCTTTYNIDIKSLDNALSPKTKAVLVTHMNGLSADIRGIENVINRYSERNGTVAPKIIFDAARSLGTLYRGCPLGKFGYATVYSFQSKKIITTLGEGGMVVTNSLSLKEKLNEYRSFGLGRSWGTNYKMTKPQAAVGSVQLSRLDSLVDARRKLCKERIAGLAHLSNYLVIADDVSYSRHCFYIQSIFLLPALSRHRDKIVRTLATQFGVGCVVANPPTYKSNPYIGEKTNSDSTPNADLIGISIFAPSIHPTMTGQDNKYIVSSIVSVLEEYL